MNNEDKASFFDYLMESGMSAKEAIELTNFKEMVAEEVKSLEDKITLGKMIPIKYLTDWENLDAKAKDRLLWEMGLDTKKYQWLEDVRCYTENSKRVCGKVVYGQERTDKDWTRKTINGVHVASLESRYFYDQDELAIMKGNKSVAKA